MRRLHGQSALEYLVTYGWAILAIVVVAALLWQLGVFNPSGLVGSGSGARGFSFLDLEHKYDGTTLQLSFGNNKGQPVQYNEVIVNGVNGTMAPVLARIGEVKLLTVTGLTSCGATGDKYQDLFVVIRYDTVGGITNKTESGYISGICG